MAILNYSTKVDFHKTIGEISALLVGHGARNISVDYEEGTPTSLSFTIRLNNAEVSFILPARYNGVLSAMEKQKVPKSMQNREQALRVAWRIIKDWVEAQMAIVEAELAEISEVFLPYAITKSGQSFYERLKNNPKLLDQ